MNTYRVTRGRFVPHPGSLPGINGGHRELLQGQTFQAPESAMLRRAVKDGDLELVPDDASASASREGHESAKPKAKR